MKTESKLKSLTVEPLAILFDIDGTLIDSAGAGGAALLAALRQQFALMEVAAVALHGRTDLGIMTELLELHQIVASADNLRRLREHYFTLLPAELTGRPGRVLPGVQPILEAVSGHSDCHVGLLTGNLPASARTKLEHFGLWDYFDFGIFGDQALHRPLLSEAAISMVRQRSGFDLPPHRIVIVGDTPLDVELARAMGARCLAVCTGGFSAAELTQAGAHRVEADLSQTDSILAWLLT